MAMFEIPYLYRARVVPRGHQNPKPVCGLGTVAVRIDEIPAGDAPPAARLVNDQGRVHRTYRALRDGLGAPVGGARKDEKGFRPWSPEEVAVILANRGIQAVRLFQRESFAGWNGSTEPTDLVRGRAHVREWQWDDRAEMEAKVMREVRGAAFVGGALHRATRGPTWSFATPYDPEDPVELRAHACLSDGDPYEAWRGDRREAARAAAAALHPRGEVRVLGDVEVLRPGAFTWDDDQAVLEKACRDLLDGTGRFIHRWPTSAISAWAALRDHMAVWPARRDDASLAAAQRAFAAVTARGIDLGERNQWSFDPAEMAKALARVRGEAPEAVPALAAPAP